MAGFVDQAFILRANDLNEWELRHNKTLYKKSLNPVLIVAFYCINTIMSMSYDHKMGSLIGKRLKLAQEKTEIARMENRELGKMQHNK